MIFIPEFGVMTMARAQLAWITAFGLLAATAQAAPAPKKDAKIWAAAEAALPTQLDLLKSVVNIDSGTGDVEGGRKVAQMLIPRLKALGASVEVLPAEAVGLPENLPVR